MRHIAVIDIGKTNAKLALVRADDLQEVAVLTRPNRVLPSPPWPHFDLDALWAFILSGLKQLHADQGIDAISVSTHGAAAVLLDENGDLAAPMLDYEHSGPDAMAAEYDALRPDFAETGSPRLGMGLNLGAQLYWQFQTDPNLRARTRQIVTYPQYWGAKLTGATACDVSSLGCHTDLWNPWTGRYSSLVDKLGLTGIIAPPHQPHARLGGLLPKVAAETGLAAGLPVSVGIHDSNASLYPHLRSRTAPFSVVSTGTWVVSMAVDGAITDLDPRRDVLVNVDAHGLPVPSARFMGGREFEVISATASATATEPATDADRQHVLQNHIALLPAVEPGSGPYPGRVAGWLGEVRTPGQRQVALSWYLALMTNTCLRLIGAQGPVIIEGPFARNRDYLDMLSSLQPGGVETAASATGTSVGAALLLLDRPVKSETTPHVPDVALAEYRRYATVWRKAVES
jgi:sugar (pentulose or hexulose) kinase